MPSTRYNCPNCESENKLILLGNDYGSFEQKCRKCSSKIEVEVNEKQEISKLESKRKTLAKNEINISMITTSEIKISVVIKKDEMTKAVKALHNAFDLDKELDT